MQNVSGVGESWRHVPANRWLLSRVCGRVRWYNGSLCVRSSTLLGDFLGEGGKGLDAHLTSETGSAGRFASERVMRCCVVGCCCCCAVVCCVLCVVCCVLCVCSLLVFVVGSCRLCLFAVGFCGWFVSYDVVVWWCWCWCWCWCVGLGRMPCDGWPRSSWYCYVRRTTRGSVSFTDAASTFLKRIK